ncbi:MAG: SUMF1/EgtB/PvdO family nonheme iron enzyme [Candidatus Tectomicrobia bacterium]|nr:SUMF1/EgtB/PvdO family nonheme iron enzyme [Candidatus Tectomicrobia bacterium]
MRPMRKPARRPTPAGRLFFAAALAAAMAGGALWAASLDRTEVTNRQYLEFLLDTGKPAPEHWEGLKVPEGAADEPVTLVNWYDARDYCAWKGRQLPSREEWQGACRMDGFQKIGDIWEWTRSEGEGGMKVLCGPRGTCDCTHRYRPEWRNSVKGFRCAGDTPVALFTAPTVPTGAGRRPAP